VNETLVSGGGIYPFDWGIDAYGRENRLTYPGGAVVDYSPNALGQPTQVSGYASAVSYHPGGAVAGYTLANGVVHSVEQNLRGLPRQWRDSGVAHDRYEYDANANVTAIADLQEGVGGRTLGYDGLDRLTSAAGVWGAASYQYDTLDNLRSSSVGGRTLVHHLDEATQRLTALSGSRDLTLQYDANGNLTRRGAQTFEFDIGNRLRSAPGVAGYGYDGLGRRTRVAYADGTVRLQAYSRAGRLLLGEQGGQGQTRYIYLGSRLIAETNSQTGTRYSHTDVLGSPVAYSGAGGQVLQRTRYEPYGATAAGTEPQGIGFTGHVNDPDTGLVYMQQRYYDPLAGRFLSVDPVTTDAKTGGHFNRYVYAENNPYKYVDPDGRAIETGWDAANVFMGAMSFMGNMATGNYVGAVADAVGIAIDATATAVPGMPGGAATALRAARAAEKVSAAASKAVKATAPYKRPSGATTAAQRASVQGRPCVKCGATTETQVAGHKEALVKEHYETGGIDKQKMRSTDAVQPECPTCSAREGAEMSRYSQEMKKELAK
jgi:RHS repeat-associated protein